MSVYTCLFSKVVQANKPTVYSSLIGVKGFLQSKDASGAFGKYVTIVNNPGQRVFPGGKGDKAKLSEALREFNEETGINFVESAQGKVTYNNNKTFPVYFEQSAYYSCAYIRTNTHQELLDLQTTITTNINAKTPVSDELNRVDIVQLENYVIQEANDAIKKYCNDNFYNLTYSSTLTDWSQFLRNNRMQWPNPTPTTKDQVAGKTVTGVKDFRNDCWNMGPFMNFIVNPPMGTPFFDFPNPNPNVYPSGIYAFMKNNESLPSKFATDWFSAMSERIVDIDGKM